MLSYRLGTQPILQQYNILVLPIFCARLINICLFRKIDWRKRHVVNAMIINNHTNAHIVDKINVVIIYKLILLCLFTFYIIRRGKGRRSKIFFFFFYHFSADTRCRIRRKYEFYFTRYLSVIGLQIKILYYLLLLLLSYHYYNNIYYNALQSHVVITLKCIKIKSQ